MRTILGMSFAVAVCLLALTADTSAQTGRGVNARQDNQRERIARGMKSGELTARESARIAREQVQINRMEKRFRSSGDGLSNRERVRLQREMNQASRHIYRQKHDRQDYPRYRKF